MCILTAKHTICRIFLVPLQSIMGILCPDEMIIHKHHGEEIR